MKKVSVVFLSIIALIAFAVLEPDAGAYETYTGCRQCHGDFRASPYTSLLDGQSWGGSLHDVHRNTMLSGDCDACHGPTRNPVVLNSSIGGAGFAPISCVGCHGRAEDRISPAAPIGDGAGLRQHHFNAGETICAGCHDDANPAIYTPVGENILPPYYFTPDASHPNKPVEPCNLSGSEDFAASTLGLDNDGDLLFDGSDPDCRTATCIDNDGDGYGSNGVSTCPNGPAIDCNDGNAAVNPGAAETCDGLDNNCNGQTDEGIASTPTICGVGICASTGQMLCQNGSMVDTCTAGTPRTEGPFGDPTCGDSLDNNCDGLTDGADPNCAGLSCTDNDSDGYAAEGGACGALDCNDSSPGIYPGAAEICGDGIDQNCNGNKDERCPRTGAEGKGKTCGDGLDNDGDGLVDCADPGCSISRLCR